MQAVNLYVFNVIHPRRPGHFDHEVQQVAVVSDHHDDALFKVCSSFNEEQRADLRIEVPGVCIKAGLPVCVAYKKWSTNLVESARPHPLTDFVLEGKSN